MSLKSSGRTRGNGRTANQRRRAFGRLVKIKNAQSVENATPKKVVITGHGGASRSLLEDPLDGRSIIGKAYMAYKAALLAHIGGAEKATMPQLTLADQAARFNVLTRIAWGELIREGAFKAGALAPAFDAYRRAAGDERDVLRLLGLERRMQPVPDLADYIAARPKDEADV